MHATLTHKPRANVFQVMDKAGSIFAAAFYHGLLAGQSVPQAFDVGQARVASEADVPVEESDKVWCSSLRPIAAPIIVVTAH